MHVVIVVEPFHWLCFTVWVFFFFLFCCCSHPCIVIILYSFLYRLADLTTTDYIMPLHNNAKKGREGDSDTLYAPERELATSRDDPNPTRGRAKPPPQPVD